MNCPCGSGNDYQRCCGPYIEGNAFPETAEALMRSRYTAYSMNRLDYIESTMMGTALEDFRASNEHSTTSNDPIIWTGLEICDSDKGQKEDLMGMVRFKARYLSDDTEHCLHERSQFLQINGQWFYTEGELLS